jgi:ABC-type multidrug transport system permease subunit
MTPGSFKELLLYRLRTCARDPGVVFWVFVFPVIAIAAFGLAFRPGAPGPSAVGLLGNDPAVRAALAPREGEPKELSIRVLASPEEAKTALGRSEVALVVVASDPPVYRFDPTRQEALVARLLVDRRLQAARGRPDAVGARLEQVDTPGIRYIDYVVPGLIGMQIMNTMLLGVGFSLVELRSRKMLRRLAATPMSRPGFLVAQVLSRLSLTWVMTALLLVVAHVLFGVRVQGSYLDVGLLVLLGGLSFSGISLAVAARTESSETAQGIITIIALPMVLFSGVFFSSSGYPFSTPGMPDWIRVPLGWLPLTAFNDALRAVVNERVSLASMPGELAILTAWGVVPFVFALRVFRWR